MWFLPLLLIICLAAGVRLVQIERPGPYSDEVFLSNTAKHFLTQRPLLDIPGIHVGGFWLPLGFSGHTGALTVYIEALFLKLTGSSFVHRYLNVGYALLALILVALLAARLWGRAYGLLLALTVALAPSFVFYSRVGNHVVFFRTVIGTAFFLLLFEWLRTRRPRRFYWLAMVTGLGFSTRLETLWLVAGFLGLLLTDPDTRRTLVELVRRPGQALAVSLACAAGSALFLVNNLANRFLPVAHVWNNLAVTLHGHDNRAFFSNLMRRFGHVRSLVEGREFPEYGATFANPVWWPLLLFSSLVLLYAAFFPRVEAPDRLFARRLLAFSLPVLAISTLSVSSIDPMHLLIVFFLPFLAILFGAVVLRRQPVLQKALLAAVLLGVALDGFNTYRYHQALSQTGGTGRWSTGIFNLVDYAEQRLRGRRVLLGNWGLYHPLDYFSAVPLELREIFGYSGGYQTIPDSFYSLVREELHRGGGPVFIFYTSGLEGGFLRRDAFVATLRQEGVGYEVDHVPDQDGRPMFDVFYPIGEPIWPSPRRPTIRIDRLYPPSVRQGARFNVQPDGRSAIAVGGPLQPSHWYTIVFARKLKESVRGRDVVTASLGPDDYARVGDYEVYLMDFTTQERSNSLVFRVLPTVEGATQ